MEKIKADQKKILDSAVADYRLELNAFLKSEEMIKEAINTFLTHIINCGSYLTICKKIIPYGKWNTWYNEQKFPVELRQAQNYMKVYNNQELVLQSGASSMADALRIIDDRQERDIVNPDGKSIPQTESIEPVKKSTRKKQTPENQLKSDLEPRKQDLDADFHEHHSYFYWAEFCSLYAKLHKSYVRLTDALPANSASTLTKVIHSIEEMSLTLKAWNPESLIPCPMCEGTGIKNEDNCTFCVKGKVATSIAFTPADPQIDVTHSGSDTVISNEADIDEDDEFSFLNDDVDEIENNDDIDIDLDF